MSPEKAPPYGLVEILARGWDPSQRKPALLFASTWQDRLAVAVEVTKIGVNELRFVTDLGSFHLRGIDAVPCLLLGGDGSDVTDMTRAFWSAVGTPGCVPFVLTVSHSTWRQARESLPEGRCLVLPPEQIEGLLDAPSPQQKLKQYLLQQIPKRQLIPYTILQPVEGAMFFGRRGELDRLREQEDVSFAIAGPSRLGKSSLLKQYRREMICARDSRVSRQFLINFYDCRDATSDGVARHISMGVDPSSRSYRMTSVDLIRFLRYQHLRLGGPVELLLDEVDDVCQTLAFEYLGAAARQGLCRLVLCGRGALLKLVLGAQSPLDCRLDLMRLEPLDPGSAQRLLVEPLADLGLSIAEPDCLVDRVFRLTGRLPHLLQFYGGRLANLAMDENTNTLCAKHVRTLEGDFETAQYFTSPLHSLSSPEARLVALALLKHHDRELSVPFVQQVAAGEGLSLNHPGTLDLCTDLVINNVLVWCGTAFRVANEALFQYARDLGFLDLAREEARQLLAERP